MRVRGVVRNLPLLTLVLLSVEFLDELVFGAREAAWPLIRDDLGLNYSQVGILLGLPSIFADLVEPAVGILGDVWRRRILILGGGIIYSAALLLFALSGSFLALLIAFLPLYPASGAFVGLSQATLMDADPARHEQSMARWTFSGSLGVVAGTLLVSAVSALALGWRPLFLAFSGAAFLLTVALARLRFPAGIKDENEASSSFISGVRDAVRALGRREVLRWLTLLKFADLLHDVLLGYLALYFVDVVRVRPEEAATAVLVWSVVMLAGDFVMIPLLERVRGVAWVRLTAAIELIAYPAFLMLGEFWAKLALLAVLGFFSAGWYTILQGQLYTSMPGKSGTVMTVSNVFNLVGGLAPFAVGMVAEEVGLQHALWLLAIAPAVLLVGMPRQPLLRGWESSSSP